MEFVDVNTDNNIDYFLSDVVSATDYYPFGSVNQNRSFSTTAYRYGFNGQEKDDEVSGKGNSNTAEFWQYDTRLGKRWNLDPITTPWLSNYSAFDNNPILNKDILGNTFEGPESKANAKAATDKAENRKTAIIARQKAVETEGQGLGKINNPNKEQKKLIEANNAEKRYLAESLIQVTKSIAEIKEMDISPQKFQLLASNDVDQGGETVYDKNTKTVIMFFNPSSKAADIHELKHGSQFLKGQTSFSPSNTSKINGGLYQSGGVLADQTDEVEAYKAGYAIDKDKPILKNPDFNYIDTKWIGRIPTYENLPDFEVNTGNISSYPDYQKNLNPLEVSGDININTVP